MPEVIERLGDDGREWRGEDRVWTKPMDPNAGWQTRANAEGLVAKPTDEIRQANGCTGRTVE